MRIKKEHFEIMVLTDIGNALYTNQQKYYQLVFFVMKIKVIKMAISSLFTQHAFIKLNY